MSGKRVHIPLCKAAGCGQILTDTGIYCPRHWAVRGLEIRPSAIAGVGLFAVRRKASDPAVVFQKDQKIADYTGELLGPGEWEQEPHTAADSYLLSVGDGWVIDARSRTGSSIARYANDARSTGRKNNARLKSYPKTRRGVLLAMRDIKDGEEITVSYGNSYWAPKGKTHAKKSGH